MKKFIFLLGLISLQYTYKPCDPEVFCTSCVSRLSTGFNFLKTYRISADKDVTEYSYVFAKGTHYMITLCDQTGNSMVVTILDSQRNKVATNMVNGKVASAISFPCQANGIYYLQFSFEGEGSHCGGSAMGFKIVQDQLRFS